MNALSARLALSAVSLALAAGGCGQTVGDARPQWVVVVSTDAPVPELGDRVLVELLSPGGASACSGCRRLFGIADATGWPLSFGIPDPGAGAGALTLRVRLFRSDHSDVGGAPVGGLPIDALALLPPTSGDVRHVAVALHTACAGVAADVEHSLACDAQSGTLIAQTLADSASEAVLVPGSFALAQTVPCGRAAPEGMACVPGGLFARGDSAHDLADVVGMPASPERLVRLGPFAIDKTEMTVRELRALVDAGRVPSPTLRSSLTPACTYTPTADVFEDFPVNCISHVRATTICEVLGKRLPTEAEWEFAAGDRDQEKRFPWGADPSACDFAIVGRGRTAAEIDTPDPSSACRRAGDGPPAPWGPRPVAESKDATDLGLRHMGGNLAEWVADAAGPYDGPCGVGPRILVDPRCDLQQGAGFVHRGGNWASQGVFAQGFLRSNDKDSDYYSYVGFRCAVGMSTP